MPSEKTTIRLKLDKKSCMSPNVDQLGWAIFNEPIHDKENLPGHSHAKAFEICYIDRGSVTWWVEDQIYHVNPGSIFITFPGEKHGGLHDIMNPCQLYWIQVRFPVNTAMGGLTLTETRSIVKDFKNLNNRTFPGSHEFVACFKKLIDEHQTPSIHSRAVVRTALAELLIAVLRSHNNHTGSNVKRPKQSNAVKRVCELINSNLEAHLKIETLAKEAGLSVTTLYLRFDEELHLTPAEYLTQQRINKARTMLTETELSITKIAVALGYSTSQYFATTFKHITGMSPSQYRKNEKDQSS